MRTRAGGPMRRGGAVAALLLVGGCGGAGVEMVPEGPFLSRGAIEGEVRMVPAVRSEPVRVPLALPAGLVERGGAARLPGATLPGVGPVRALVVPVVLGRATPARSQQVLAGGVFAGAEAGSATSLAAELERASGGRLRFQATVLEPLVDPREGLGVERWGGTRWIGFARDVLGSWAGRIDLGDFDDDGADGVAASRGSRDDDGRLDFVMITVEAPAAVQSATVRGRIPLRSEGRRYTADPVHVYALPAAAEPIDLREPVGLVLDALGLDPDERFFPRAFPRLVSTLARVRLGWVPVTVWGQEGVYDLADGRAILVKVHDLPDGTGFWLVERDGAHVFTSRVVRKADGHYQATDVNVWGERAREILPLNRQLGAHGPYVLVAWPAGGGVKVEIRPDGGAPTLQAEAPRRADDDLLAMVRALEAEVSVVDGDAGSRGVVEYARAEHLWLPGVAAAGEVSVVAADAPVATPARRIEVRAPAAAARVAHGGDAEGGRAYAAVGDPVTAVARLADWQPSSGAVFAREGRSWTDDPELRRLAGAMRHLPREAIVASIERCAEPRGYEARLVSAPPRRAGPRAAAG